MLIVFLPWILLGLWLLLWLFSTHVNHVCILLNFKVRVVSLSKAIMPKVSTYTLKRIQSLHEQSLHPAEVLKTFKGDLAVSYQSVARIISKLKLTSSTNDLPRSGLPRKVNPEAKSFIEEQMRRNYETTGREIQKLAKHVSIVHASTFRRSRKEQGWTLQQTTYCQLIREANKFKRLEVAQRVLDSVSPHVQSKGR